MNDYEDAYAEGSEHELRADDNGPVPSAQARVRAGMAFLDEHTPNHVVSFNPSEFHIMNRGGEGDRRCALLQATDTEYWFSAQGAVGITHDEALELGFYPLGDEPFGDNTFWEQDLSDLNAAWLAAYAERQAA